MRAKDLPVTTGGTTSDKILKVNASGTLENITVANLATLMNVATTTYTKYVALLTQTGTSAPTAIVLENTLGFTPTWTYDSVGTYFINSSTGFTLNKTFVMIANGLNQSPVTGIYIQSTSRIDVVTTSAVFGLVNDALFKTAIEIRIYP